MKKNKIEKQICFYCGLRIILNICCIKQIKSFKNSSLQSKNTLTLKLNLRKTMFYQGTKKIEINYGNCGSAN